MNVYVVKRNDPIYYSQDYAIVVVAKDELHAERKARQSSMDFKKNQRLEIIKVDLETEQTVLKANMGD